MNGTSTITSSSICTNALINAVDTISTIFDNRFFWVPSYSIKFSDATSEFSSYLNVANVYCNLNQWQMAIFNLFDSSSSVAYGKAIARILTALASSWWFDTNCIIDGILGQNFYDIGNCSGKLIVIILGVTLG